ncbi:hypothetical protein SKA58_02230 [Sphingomonas sp. SKA58]|nr:hypothetical protein SKA58_02230 [Sphingomonas sp. SKA58]
MGERSSRSGTRTAVASALRSRPSRNDAGSARLTLASCARLRRARCRDNPSGWFGGGFIAGFNRVDRTQGFHCPVAADANRVTQNIAKGALAQLLDGDIFDHCSISAAQSAAGIQNFLREFALPCFEIGKAFTLVHLGHASSFTIRKVCPPGRMIDERRWEGKGHDRFYVVAQRLEARS